MESSVDQELHVHGRRLQGHQGRSTETEGPPRSAVANSDARSVCGIRRLLIPSCFSRSSGPPLSPAPPPRVYQVWPGKNVFFVDGRVICGPDPRGLILAAMAVLLSDWVFLAYVVDPSLAHPVLLSAFSMILALTITATLLLTATRDPGIIPRNPVSPSEEPVLSTARRTPSRLLIVNGAETRLTFCRICKIFRPPRSSHCAICDNCVDKFDHHCPWISQCVGLRNYRFYLLLMCLALEFYTFIFTFSVRRIRVKLDIANAGVFSLVRTLPETCALAAFSFMVMCSLAFLLVSHTVLVAKNETSHERNKGRYLSSPNPYDKGVLTNIMDCLFDRLPPPRVDFRAVAELNLGSAARTTANSASSPDAGRPASNTGC